MAKIEDSLVKYYCKELLKNCPKAAFIQTCIATLLEGTCKPSPTSILNEKTKKHEVHMVCKFFYADNMCIEPHISTTPPPVDLLELKSKCQATAHSMELTAEAIAVLKRLERLNAASATPDNKCINPQISEAVTDLRLVCFFNQHKTLLVSKSLILQLLSENIARLGKMKTTLNLDQEAEMDPRLKIYQPKLDEFPHLDFIRRPPFKHPLVRKHSISSPKSPHNSSPDHTSEDLSDDHDNDIATEKSDMEQGSLTPFPSSPSGQRDKELECEPDPPFSQVNILSSPPPEPQTPEVETAEPSTSHSGPSQDSTQDMDINDLHLSPPPPPQSKIHPVCAELCAKKVLKVRPKPVKRSRPSPGMHPLRLHKLIVYILDVESQSHRKKLKPRVKLLNPVPPGQKSSDDDDDEGYIPYPPTRASSKK